MDVGKLCFDMASLLQIIGYVLLIFKIAIPIIIIALGMFDFGKAVVAEKEDEIKKQTKRLIMRVIAGVVIFFVPTLVMFIFELLGGYTEANNQVSFENCKTCILKPRDCDTSRSK